MMAAPLQTAEAGIGGSAWKQLLTTGAAHFGFRLSDAQVQRFQIFAEELLAWNRRINLTRITAPDEIALKHFVDSLPGAGDLETGWRVIDLGSGGGFPGIPLKIVRPDLEITLVDAIRKKVSFQKHICRQLGFRGIECLHARIEKLGEDPAYQGGYQAAISRALTDLDLLCRLAAPLLTVSGVVVAYRGRVGAPHRSQEDRPG
ncbi:MAG: 16S rRNA (guanine(527)-N(7))-methyltransferase RsmG, partial [Desulfosarcinaceae bacterium]